MLLDMIPAILIVASLAFQTVPSAPTPAGAPLPSKGKLNAKGVNSELAGDTKEDGVLSFARYEAGSFSLKANRVSTYVNEHDVVLVQGKQRFAIPVQAIAEVLDGNGVPAQVNSATGTSIASTGKPTANPTLVGIVWTDAGKKNAIVLRVDKGDFATFVSSLESVTGLKATNTDAK
jgi:hypothetical protein